MQEHRPFLPHGFQFRPSDEELIEHYLKKKVSGIFIPLAEYFISDCNLYEKKPSEIWDSHGGPFLNADEDLYFFTQLKKKSSKGSRIDRKVGSSGGTWQGEDAGKDIVSGKSKIKIGSKKRFRYEKQGCEDHGAWIMHEYTLHMPKNQATNYVLCRLRKNQPTGHDIMKYGSAKKRKLKGFQDNSNQSEQVADIEMDRLLTHQQNQQQNYMDYQEVSCSSSDMMSEQSLAGGMGLASSVYEPSMEMMMSHFDQMICNQQYDSGNNMLQGGETGENYHCHSESIAEVPMAVSESLVQHEESDGLPELIEEDYSFLEDLLHGDAEEPIGDVSGSFGLMLDLDDLLS
ncbi:NAC domain-containing protein [Citrus sinensis]|uniref:NAC domain-containing protein n=1 Tax=Citrus sinensis TaxID=2711 RepID=A0ACB8LCK9_CITSI|nr:NAC domain-containing protein [Citrus sinensis]